MHVHTTQIHDSETVNSDAKSHQRIARNAKCEHIPEWQKRRLGIKLARKHGLVLQ